MTGQFYRFQYNQLMNYILKDMCQEYDFRNNILKIGYHFTSSLIRFEHVTCWDNLIKVKPKALSVFFLVLILLCVSQEEFA